MGNLTIATEYVTAIEGEFGMLKRRIEATWAPDAYVDEKLDNIRIYIEQLRIELDPLKGREAVKSNKRQEKGT